MMTIGGTEKPLLSIPLCTISPSVTNGQHTKKQLCNVGMDKAGSGQFDPIYSHLAQDQNS